MEIKVDLRMKRFVAHPRQIHNGLPPLELRICRIIWRFDIPGNWASRVSVFLVMMAAGFLIPPSTRAQQVSESEWKRGFHGFNVICKNAGLTHESSAKWMTSPANQRVLVVLGNASRIPFSIDRFIERGGAVLMATDRQDSKSVRRHGIGFSAAPIQTQFQRDRFRNYPDCPIVTDTRIHPSLENVNSIVTNRPGLLTKFGSSGTKMIAYLPSQESKYYSNRLFFIATAERPNGGRLMCVADQSVFSNQMLIHGDNAIFSMQAINWLKNENRTHLLVVADGSVQAAVDPSGVEVMLPPPTRQEVLDALKNLPPSAMLEFGNVVATVVEDENMVNEFIHSSVDQVRPVVMRRALIFLSFAAICTVSLFTYIWQKKLMRQTASEVAFQRSKKSHRFRRSNVNDQAERWSRQRQTAAGVLLRSFCEEIAHRQYDDWPKFPAGLVDEPDAQTRAMLKSMAIASKQFRKKKPVFWTTQRLTELEQDVAKWKTVFRSSSIVQAAAV